MHSVVQHANDTVGWVLPETVESARIIMKQESVTRGAITGERQGIVQEMSCRALKTLRFIFLHVLLNRSALLSTLPLRMVHLRPFFLFLFMS